MKRFLALSVLFGLTGLPVIGCGGGHGSTSFTTNPQAWRGLCYRRRCSALFCRES